MKKRSKAEQSSGNKGGKAEQGGANLKKGAKHEKKKGWGAKVEKWELKAKITVIV